MLKGLGGIVSKCANLQVQSFDVAETLPSVYAIAAAVAVPGVISQTRDTIPLLKTYGVFGELVKVAGIAVPFAIMV